MYKYNFAALTVVAAVVLGFNAEAGPDGTEGPSCRWNENKPQVVQTPMPTASQLLKVTNLPKKKDEFQLNSFLRSLPKENRTGS